METAEIVDEMAYQNVIRAKKITKFIDGNRRNTASVILTFNSIKLPDKVEVGYEKIYVRPNMKAPEAPSSAIFQKLRKMLLKSINDNDNDNSTYLQCFLCCLQHYYTVTTPKTNYANATTSTKARNERTDKRNQSNFTIPSRKNTSNTVTVSAQLRSGSHYRSFSTNSGKHNLDDDMDVSSGKGRNCRSLRNKDPYLSLLVNIHRRSVICLQKTRLDDQPDPSVLKHQHLYKRYDGHGVAIYTHKTLTQTEVALNTPLEAVACRVKFNDAYLAICSLYLPHNTSMSDDITSLISQLPGNRLISG